MFKRPAGPNSFGLEYDNLTDRLWGGSLSSLSLHGKESGKQMWYNHNIPL